MTRLLLLAAVVAALFAMPTKVSAQTTTTTAAPTTTTTTIRPSLEAVSACTITSDQPLGSGKYRVSGHLTGADSYATGGMTFGVPNTLKAAGRCLCNSFARKPITILFNPTNGYTFNYNSSARTLYAYTTAATEVTATTDLSGTGPISFFAICE